MNFKQFRYVEILAREGSFSRAANALNISQPSLSQYIKKIESQIGLALFDRASGDVRLTDAGRVYLDAGRKFLDLEHQMETRFSDIASNKAGSVIVGTSPYRTAGLMPAVARRFQELYPGMHLVIRERSTAELAEGMEHGEYDLCLSMLPAERRRLSWEKAAEEELLLAVPGDWETIPAVEMADRRYPAVDASAADGKPFIMLTEHQYMQKQLAYLMEDYDLGLRTAAVVRNLQSAIAMVRAGVGMALMPTGFEHFCAEGEVTFYSFVQPLPRREVVVMWRKDRGLSQAAETLKQIILEMIW